MNKINENIKMYRLSKKLSQEKLAEKTYTTKSTISKWESGAITPSVDILKIIAKALNVMVFDLMGEKAPVSKRIVDVIGRVFIWLFVWVHVDITMGVTIGAMGLGLTVAGVAGGTVGWLAVIIERAALGAGFNHLAIIYIVGLFFIGPLFTLLMSSVGLALLYITKLIYQFSAKYFWRIKLKDINFNIKIPKINKPLMIVLIIMSIIGVAIIAGVLGYAAQGHWGLLSS